MVKEDFLKYPHTLRNFEQLLKLCNGDKKVAMKIRRIYRNTQRSLERQRYRDSTLRWIKNS